MSDFKCNWVENAISVETDGWTRPCCLETNTAARISNINDGIKIAFNHPKLLKLKEDLKEGFSEDTRYACNRCEQMEKNSGNSMRTGTAPLSDKRELKLIQFKMSNKCQLTCAHCGPSQSSGWSKLLNISPRVINSFDPSDAFLEELADTLSSISVLKFTGGEPFLDPAHWKILKYLQKVNRKHCKLVYITNGLVTPQSDLWQGWGEVSCSVSADGFKDSFEWFRRGAKWDELVAGADALAKHSTVSINFAITPYTIFDYHASKNFWKYNFSEYPVIHPAHCNLQGFPRSIIESISGYESIPFHDLSTDPGDTSKYIKWANWWDSKWSTPGLSEKVIKWMEI